jgi:hypothetical protein
VLRQLPSRLATHASLFVDCQGISATSTAEYALTLTFKIVESERDGYGNSRISPLSAEKLTRDPLSQLSDWLDKFAKTMRQPRILLCLDEFQMILSRIRDHDLDIQVLDLLRSLSQSSRYQVIYNGLFLLDDLTRDYSSYFNNVRRKKISFLDEEAVRDLIVRPEPNYDQMKYEQEAVDEIVRQTRCHPLLVQAICAELVTRLNKLGTRTVIMNDVHEVLPSVFAAYANPIDSIFKVLNDEEYGILTAIARSESLKDRSDAIRRLIDRDYIEEDADGKYRFQVPMLGTWWLMQ